MRGRWFVIRCRGREAHGIERVSAVLPAKAGGLAGLMSADHRVGGGFLSSMQSHSAKFGLTMFDDFRYCWFVIHLVHRHHHHHAQGASAGVFG